MPRKLKPETAAKRRARAGFGSGFVPTHHRSLDQARLGTGRSVPGQRRVTRDELAYAIERWGVFRWCITKQRRIQLQIWTPDRELALRLCAQYERKFYTCRVTRPYLRPATTVYPVTFSQRGTAAILMWARDKFQCPRHREIALKVFIASERAKRVRSVYGRIQKGETKYLFASRRREEFRESFFEARDSLLRFWKECPVSLYGEYVRIKDAERAGAIRSTTTTADATTTILMPPKAKAARGTRAVGIRTGSTS